MRHKNLTAYVFERSCGISNGYLKKQLKGKGGIGSQILEKIYYRYRDLDIVWLITGKGDMLRSAEPDTVSHAVNEEPAGIEYSRSTIITTLKRQVKLLEEMNADKEKLIRLLEKKRKM